MRFLLLGRAVQHSCECPTRGVIFARIRIGCLSKMRFSFPPDSRSEPWCSARRFARCQAKGTRWPSGDELGRGCRAHAPPVVREGDYSYDVLAIEEGTAVVTRGGEEIAQLGAGDVIGEMGVLERDQRNATVVATSSMLLTTLTRWDIKRLEKSAPEVVSHLRELVEQRRDQA